MRQKYHGKITVALVALLMITGCFYLLAPGQESGKVERDPVGVWQTVITPRSCLTGDQVAPSFRGLLTFNKGGTLAEIAAVTSPALRTPGHGVWRKESGWSGYSMDFMFYRFNQDGVLIGSQRIRQDIELDQSGDGFTSTGTVQVIGLNGAVIATGCSTSTGVRFG